MPRAKAPNNSNPAEPAERSRVAAAALGELGDGEPKSPEPEAEVLPPIPPGYEDNITGCLTLAAKVAAIGLANMGQREAATALLDNCEEASAAASPRIASLLSGRVAGGIMWGGLISAFIGLPLARAARAAISPAKKPGQSTEKETPEGQALARMP